MLRKLIRQEFLSTWKVLTALNAFMLLVGIVGCFVVSAVIHFAADDNEVTSAVIMSGAVSWGMVYIVAVLAVSLGALIILTLRYYRSMYTDEGYITFTLPVPTADLLHARVINGLIWLFIGVIVIAISTLFIVVGIVYSIDSLTLAELKQGVIEFLSTVAGPATVALFIFEGIVMIIYRLMSIYFCVTVGQLMQKHRVLGAIIAYFGLGFVNRFINSFYSLGSMFRIADMLENNVTDYYNGTLLFRLVYQAVSVVVFYFVIRLINNNKLNLE